MRIGVISDTHGLVRPEALTALESVDAIVLAGDIGKPHVLDELQSIAPLFAIVGNVDVGKWADAIPATRTLELGGWRIHLVHDVSELDPEVVDTVDVVVFGHSHKPLVQWRDGVLFLNPGSAGPRRFKLPITLAHLDLDENGIDAHLVQLVE